MPQMNPWMRSNLPKQPGYDYHDRIQRRKAWNDDLWLGIDFVLISANNARERFTISTRYSSYKLVSKNNNNPIYNYGRTRSPMSMLQLNISYF
jgi:hypothetical protein